MQTALYVNIALCKTFITTGLWELSAAETTETLPLIFWRESDLICGCTHLSNAPFSNDRIGEVQECGSSIASLCGELSNIASDIRNIYINLN